MTEGERVVFIQIGNGEGGRKGLGGDEWQLGTSRRGAAPMLSLTLIREAQQMMDVEVA